MASNPSQRRGQSSTTESKSGQIIASVPGSTSPMRKPLHERSRSQTNQSPSHKASAKLHKIYQQTPFPKLPSQIFSPKAGPYIFEDSDAGSAPGPKIPPKSPARSIRSSSSTGTLNEQAEEPAHTPPMPDVPTLDAEQSSGSRQLSRPESARTFEDIFGPGVTSRKGGRQKNILRKAAPNQSQTSLTSPPSADSETFAARRKRQNKRSKEKNAEQEDPKIPLNEPDAAQPQHKSLERVRSQSSVAARKAKGKEVPSAETLDPRQERPRSASGPATPTEAFIQSLLVNDTTKLQYPEIRQPSVNSLRSQASSSKPTYPAPLRLQRKRANSQLRRAASGAPLALTAQKEEWSTSIGPPKIRQTPSKVSVVSQSTVNSSQYEAEIGIAASYGPQRASANWADEIEDTVPELEQGPYMWRQKSDYQRNSFNESRPTTRDSSRSGKGSFYNFLNDSKTAWTNVYYRNEARIRLETPPRVTQLQPSLETSDEGALHRTASDVHSQSPSSAGFPEALYVKRVRPFAAQLQPRQFPSTSSLRYSSSLSTMRTVHHSAGPSLVETATTATGNQYATQGSGNNSPITALPPVTPPANVTLALEPIPRLSPDKRHGSRLIAWRAPSLDESDSKRNFLFGPLNRQIFLFCIGFVFPVAWWIAGVLPLPNRPRIQGPEMRESGVGEWSGSVVERDGGTRLDQAIDLFNVEEVRRYQEARWWRALNRVMSILGLLVVGAVIACAIVATR